MCLCSENKLLKKANGNKIVDGVIVYDCEACQSQLPETSFTVTQLAKVTSTPTTTLTYPFA